MCLEKLLNEVNFRGLGQMALGSRLNRTPDTLSAQNREAVHKSFILAPAKEATCMCGDMFPDKWQPCCCLQLTEELVKHHEKDYLSKTKLDERFAQN